LLLKKLMNYIFINTISITIGKQDSFIDYISNPGTIIAFSAILVSIIGLVFSVRYNRKTLEQSFTHNKLSIEPLISVMHYLKAIKEDREDSFELINSGLGPAKIKSLKFHYEDNIYIDIMTIFREKINFFANMIDANLSSSTYLNDDYVLAQHDRIEIYHIHITNAILIPQLKDFNNKIVLKVKYETLYSEERLYKTDLVFLKD